MRIRVRVIPVRILGGFSRYPDSCIDIGWIFWLKARWLEGTIGLMELTISIFFSSGLTKFYSISYTVGSAQLAFTSA